MEDRSITQRQDNVQELLICLTDNASSPEMLLQMVSKQLTSDGHFRDLATRATHLRDDGFISRYTAACR